MLFVADSAKTRIDEIREREQYGEDYFVRVGVTSGGCSGLSYGMDFDNEDKPDDQVFEHNGVKIVGISNLPAQLPTNASQLLSRNIDTFLSHLVNEGAFSWDAEDEITTGTLITHQGSTDWAAQAAQSTDQNAQQPISNS